MDKKNVIPTNNQIPNGADKGEKIDSVSEIRLPKIYKDTSFDNSYQL